jgi:hypothetical protein
VDRKSLSVQRFNRGSTPVNRGSTPVEIGSTESNIREDNITQDKIRQLIIPSFEEFKEHAEQKDFYDPLMEKALKVKYENWKDSGWIDGHGNAIKNWKVKLNNTIPHLEKSKPVVTSIPAKIELSMG